MGEHKTGEFREARPSLHYYFPQGTIIRKPATAIDACHLKTPITMFGKYSSVSHTKTSFHTGGKFYFMAQCLTRS
jgi:hypothetical protein